MFAPKDAEKEKAKQAGCKRVRDWLEDFLPPEEKDEDDGGAAPPGKETNVIVTQLACMEEGCPDVEVVMTLLRAKPRPKLMFKIFKPAADLTSAEVESAMKAALAEEAKAASPAAEGGHSHGHDEAAKAEHGHDEHGHVHDGDCCGHDHADGEHKHGHDEAKHENEHGHAS